MTGGSHAVGWNDTFNVSGGGSGNMRKESKDKTKHNRDQREIRETNKKIKTYIRMNNVNMKYAVYRFKSDYMLVSL